MDLFLVLACFPWGIGICISSQVSVNASESLKTCFGEIQFYSASSLVLPMATWCSIVVVSLDEAIWNKVMVL